MSMDERQEYMDENVYPVRKYYMPFWSDKRFKGDLRLSE